MHSRELWGAVSAVWIAAAVCGCACTGSEEDSDKKPADKPAEATPEAAAPEAAAPAPPAPPEEEAEMAPVKVAAKKVAGDGKALGRRYRELLNAGRKQVQAKDFAGGIATFREALKADPSDPRLLGELSYAASQKGDHKLAERAARDCVRNSQDLKISGSCYYNLGKAQEDQGDKEAAATSYRLSLAVRPGNKVVQSRLDGLSMAAPPPDAGQRCGGLECAPAASLKALCGRLLKAAEREAGMGADEGGGEQSCKPISSRKMKGEGIKNIALLEVSLGFGSWETSYYLAMEGEGGWMPAARVGYVYNPGAFGVYEEGDFRVAVKDLIAGGPEEVVVRSSINHHDSDLGIAEAEDETVVQEVVCELREGQPWCYGPILLQYQYVREHMEEVFEEGMERNAQLPIRVEHSYEVKYLGDGDVEISAAGGQIPAGRKALLGTHKLRALPKVEDMVTR